MDAALTSPPTPHVGPDPDVDLEMDLLIEAIWRKYAYDFRGYARNSLRRRLIRATQVLGMESISMLQHGILRDRALFASLVACLTVPVSDMFRNPSFFLALRRDVLPELDAFASLRIWVAGCSTGEEAYSLAILLDEAGLLERAHIYATDISPAALRTASSGVYSMDRVPAFTHNYQHGGGTRSLADYYLAAYGGVVLSRHLRKRVTFADHSLATDEVFAEIHLVTCRNVLIYFDAPLRSRALGLFRDALVPGGFLGLGAHERLGPPPAADAFDTLPGTDRIYRRRATMRAAS